MISLKTHSVMDYLAAGILLVTPFLLGFSMIDPARNLFLLAGGLLLGYSLLTKYPISLWRVLPLGAHMTLDTAIGAILILGPWVLGYRNLLTGGQEFAHYALGLGLILFVAATRSKTEAEKRAQEPTYPSRFSVIGGKKAG